MPVTQRDAPSYYVRAVPDGSGGPALRVDLSQRVLSFKYDDEERRADKLTITVDNYDLSLFDDPAFKKGMILEAQWGYPGNMAPARELVVTSIKGGLQLTVVANAKSLLLNRVVRNRRFERVRRSDVVRQIATTAGYSGEALDIEETPTVLESIQQGRLTDAQLLRRLADLEGFEFYVDYSGFHWHARRFGQRPLRVLRYFIDQRGEILSFDIENDVTARPKPGRTRLRGRDPINRSDIDASEDDATDSGRSALAAITDIVAPSGTADQSESQQAAESSTFERVDAETRQTRIEAQVAGEETLCCSAPNQEVAQREARARFRKLQQTAVKMRCDVIGDPGLLSKTVVEVQGLGQRLSGKYYVKQVATSIDASGGYKQTLTLISDGSGGHSTSSQLARGLDLVNPGPQTRGRVNRQEPAPGAQQNQQPGAEEPPQLVPVEQVNEETRQTEIVYTDPQGQSREST